jgi:hypothetical protein
MDDDNPVHTLRGANVDRIVGVPRSSGDGHLGCLQDMVELAFKESSSFFISKYLINT